MHGSCVEKLAHFLRFGHSTVIPIEHTRAYRANVRIKRGDGGTLASQSDGIDAPCLPNELGQCGDGGFHPVSRIFLRPTWRGRRNRVLSADLAHRRALEIERSRPSPAGSDIDRGNERS
jgi:hypothetical protein